MTRKRPRAIRVAAIVVALGVLAGAAYAGTARHAKVTNVQIATPAKTTDYGWNQVGVNNAKTAAAAAGASFKATTNIGYDKTAVVLRQLASSGADFIIAHASGYDTDANRLGPQLKVPMMTYDNPKLLVKNYISNITTQSQEGAYLAGILAAKMTKQHKLGIVISASDTNWYKMSGGFAAGVRSVDKASKVYFVTLSKYGYDDAAAGKRVASTVIRPGRRRAHDDGRRRDVRLPQCGQHAEDRAQGLDDRRHRRPDADRQEARLPVLRALDFHEAVRGRHQGHQRRHVRDARLHPRASRTAASHCSRRSTFRPPSGRRSSWRRPASSKARSRSPTARPRAASTTSSSSHFARRASRWLRPPRMPEL